MLSVEKNKGGRFPEPSQDLQKSYEEQYFCTLGVRQECSNTIKTNTFSTFAPPDTPWECHIAFVHRFNRFAITFPYACMWSRTSCTLAFACDALRMLLPMLVRASVRLDCRKQANKCRDLYYKGANVRFVIQQSNCVLRTPWVNHHKGIIINYQ